MQWNAASDGWFDRRYRRTSRLAPRYRFRIDDEIDVPDPASAFQPDETSRPSEVIDHARYPWRAADWRGRPWHEAVVVEIHVGTFTSEGTYRADDRQARSSRRDRLHCARTDAAGGFPGARNWGYDGVLLVCARQRLRPARRLKALIEPRIGAG